jgi:hypothetical protein
MKTFSKNQLETMRQVADLPADTVIEKFLRQASQEQAKALMSWLVSSENSVDISIAEEYTDFFKDYFLQNTSSSEPVWVNPEKIKEACHFFQKHSDVILWLLGVLSLPYCYAGANGVKVLYLSQRIQQNTLKRLNETALFVLNVMRYENFENGRTNFICLKIRLLHAAIRFFTQKHSVWDSQKYGVPVCQEDMAGTNLAFSYIVIRGIRKLGYNPTLNESENFLHLWKLIGFWLGVDETLLPDTLQEAYWLDKQIAERQFASSHEGIMLTKSLLEAFSQSDGQTPDLSQTALSQMHLLLGEKISGFLQLPAVSKGLDVQGFVQNIAFKELLITNKLRLEKRILETKF